MEGGETRGIGQGVSAQEGGEDCFEAGLAWGCETGVDEGGVGWGVGLGRLEMRRYLVSSRVGLAYVFIIGPWD